jgi:3' terminal RNA ribose 2'-O-methyltransferase Hen1
LLLTISTTYTPATDLGYLLHKNPARVQDFSLPFGRAHVFYPEANEERCTAALLLDVDPVALVRGRSTKTSDGGLLTQYVNDRPYVASSFLSVAISRVFGSALGGRSRERPDLIGAPIPLAARIAALPCRGGDSVVRRLFEPLGYEVRLEDPEAERPEGDWERGPCRNLTLEAEKTLSDLLTHLYVLIPVLDNDKHYWVGSDEVEKLLRHGEGWLAGHPEKELIANRYLKHRRSLAREALARLSDEDEPDPEAAQKEYSDEEEALERPIRLNDVRMETVVRVLHDSGARRVLDLGCGEGRLLRELLRDRQFDEILGLDASVRALEIAYQRLNLERLPTKQRERIQLLHGALTYRDARLAGYDAAAVVEVIEHLDLARLAVFERVLFDSARPETAVITTPNREYNAKFPNLADGSLRHRDHRFEWTRDEFAVWTGRVASQHGYSVEIEPVGEVDSELGAPTQMGVFRRCA